ncbi:hypothetical protein [Nonomuraea cavernae]|uniref:Uncharacterized protein n=1 Tax=Nonomuraea cavernae TaxID=2045107 RepID=A0A917ZGE5_9ACTN|nr:hypothetical protein [Nonomuraea cavernae]MCA2190730.1 hypothetical protein [Nonomuraea cavernae]GGO82042.1 hypothetical protein GCM10012289_72370 [Nonomuraea cavernae]
MISIQMSATPWLTFACRNSVRLVDGPARLRQHESARSQAAAYALAHLGASADGVPVSAGASQPTQQFTKGGMRGPQPWRDAPVIT